MRTKLFAIGTNCALGLTLLCTTLSCPAKSLHLTRADYEDRVQAAWTAQIAACLMGFQFEHKVASVQWVDSYPKKFEAAIVDDDWYYEMCAVRAFEKHGIALTVRQLGEQWKENSCGSWGSSEQARFNLAKGINAPECGHPRYNKLWWTIGPQFSAEVYGLMAPGMPNVAAKLARELSHVNGFAEGSDGAVFVAGMVSLGFIEKDPRQIVKKAAKLIHPSSPYRKMLDEIIAMAEAGKTAQEICDMVEDRWHIEYPATNNAVPNGGIVAVGLWFGEGDFLKTVNIVYHAADFTDADCNAANAAAVIAVMHGSKCIPKNLVEPLHDRIVDEEMGRVKLTPPVDEKISDLARRTAVLGGKFIVANRGKIKGEDISILTQETVTQPAELFALGDLMAFWNADWKLERAGFGGAGGGLGNMRGITLLEGDTLVTWPRDPVRGVVLRRDVKLGEKATLSFSAGAEGGRAWELEVYANNKRVFRKLIDASTQPVGDRVWEDVNIDLSKFGKQQVQLRLYQRALLADKIPGNAYWRQLVLKQASK
ncbi:MAG: hypothetical protein JWM68_1275 [Verrucomicrobiales bacterium]|nr:hypothetical protein [Verrucomicrobiales bacterium]